ncbi:hypothetical protein [Halobiforma nitratireducens]|uniref:Uncharacterized protein n=1 Tax=Halobiforma nitratireducens JCM 10879 TaxID=1227454 RepID=M0LY03_9EURY|nr:hypothetical protein [Halobiforma nitratireducens]EMA37239.1 hypothetical protein C446_11050 [Halobiforma nitratireducens JCM 10879]
MAYGSTEGVDRFLGVLDRLGVTNAELRRLYDCSPDEQLREAVRRAATEDRTRELERALEDTGRAFELGTRVTTEVGEPLSVALNAYGYALDVSSSGPELEVVAFDTVTNTVERVRAPPYPDPFRDALESAVLAPAGLCTVALANGATLLVDRRSLARLRDEYGNRIEPFGEPLLRADAGPTETLDPQAHGEDRERQPTTGERLSETASDGEVGDIEAFVENASDRALEALSEELEASGPSRHVSDGIDEDEVDRTIADGEVGGGPTTTVSTSGIDEVFDDLETTISSDSGADADCDRDGGHTSTDATESVTSDTGGEPDDSSPNGNVESDIHGDSEPTIADRSTGETDFADLVAQTQEDDVDPDAILSEDDDVLVED